MTPRTRALTVLTLGFLACFGAGWIATLPLQEAGDSWETVRGKLEESRTAVETLDPSDPASLAALQERLAEAEQLGDARRDEIANSGFVRILISVLCTALAYLVAIRVAARLTTGGEHPHETRRRRAHSPRVRAAASPDERVFVADPRGRVVSVNATLANDLARPVETVVGRPLAEFFGGDGAEAFEAIVAGLTPDTPSARVEAPVGDGTARTWLALELHARFSEDGSMREIVGSGSDITVARRSRPTDHSITPIDVVDESPVLTGRRILVASGREEERRLIEFYLRQAGATVTGTADEASTLAAADGSSDLILIDRGLPGDGALETVRAMRTAGRNCPIFLVAHETRTAERARALEAGCSEVLRKPIDRRHLLATLAAVLPRLHTTS